MNNFATLKYIDEFKHVVYYSIVINGDEEQKSLYEEFTERWEIQNIDKLNHIKSWLALIGDKYGATENNFRHEKKASALPPREIEKEPAYLHFGKKTANNLRLYCHRLNKHVVILFSGAEKTARKAQDCDSVKGHFDLANKLALAIDDCLKKGDITWNDDSSDILYELNLKIEI